MFNSSVAQKKIFYKDDNIHNSKTQQVRQVNGHTNINNFGALYNFILILYL